jgi:glutaredoxin-related protein
MHVEYVAVLLFVWQRLTPPLVRRGAQLMLHLFQLAHLFVHCFSPFPSLGFSGSIISSFLLSLLTFINTQIFSKPAFKSEKSLHVYANKPNIVGVFVAEDCFTGGLEGVSGKGEDSEIIPVSILK